VGHAATRLGELILGTHSSTVRGMTMGTHSNTVKGMTNRDTRQHGLRNEFWDIQQNG
jgi:hypothetical protein